MLNPLSTSIFQYLIEEATDAVVIMDADCRVRYVNPAMSKLAGYGTGELVGESLNGVLPDVFATGHDQHVRNYVAGTHTAGVLGRVRELALRHRSGEIIPVELKAVDLGLEDGVRYFGAIMIDLRRQRDIEAKNAALMAQLEQQALTDALTGLPNRRAFDLEAARVMAHAQREGWPVTVGLADIDWFKKVNDHYGHAAGDTVMQSIAQAIQNLVRGGDLFGRIGGDEFGLLMPRATAAQATAVAERIRAVLADTPIVLTTQESITITISIGLAQLDPEASLVDALAHADAALYKAKLMGRNKVVVAQ